MVHLGLQRTRQETKKTAEMHFNARRTRAVSNMFNKIVLLASTKSASTVKIGLGGHPRPNLWYPDVRGTPVAADTYRQLS